MERKVREDVLKLARRPESEDKAKRSEKLHTLPDCFPGKKWYEQQKPAEVKPLIDHSTGLCKLCESSGLNYLTLVKAVKRLCVCKTSECPNWTCVCLEDAEDERQCSCACSCDSCVGCQVQQFVLRIKRWKNPFFVGAQYSEQHQWRSEGPGVSESETPSHGSWSLQPLMSPLLLWSLWCQVKWEHGQKKEKKNQLFAISHS